MQKNVANRIRDLTGSETIMLNDHVYMKNLCKRLEAKRQVVELFSSSRFLIIIFRKNLKPILNELHRMKNVDIYSNQ